MSLAGPVRALEIDKRFTTDQVSAYGNGAPSIHTDLAVARRRGFPALVVYGNQIARLFGAPLCSLYQRQWLDSGRVSVRFLQPAFVGDLLRLTGWEGFAHAADDARTADGGHQGGGIESGAATDHEVSLVARRPSDGVVVATARVARPGGSGPLDQDALQALAGYRWTEDLTTVGVPPVYGSSADQGGGAGPDGPGGQGVRQGPAVQAGPGCAGAQPMTSAAWDALALGTELGRRTYTVTAADVRRFAWIMRERAPWYCADGEQTYVPTQYFDSEPFDCLAERYGLPRGVHATLDSAWHRSVRVPETVRCTTRLAGRFATRSGRRGLTFRTEVAAGGEPVSTVVSSVVLA